MNDNNMKQTDVDLEKFPIEEMSDEMINSYVDAIGGMTPNLWDRIEAGYEEEIQKSKTIDFAAAKARRRKMLGACAAAVALVAIAVPTMILTRNASTKDKDDTEVITTVKSDFTLNESAAVNYADSDYDDEFSYDAESDMALDSSDSATSSSKSYYFINPYVNPADHSNGVALDLKGKVTYDSSSKQYIFSKNDTVSVGELVYDEDEYEYNYVENDDYDLDTDTTYDSLQDMPIAETELLNMAVTSVGLNPEDINISVEVIVIVYDKGNGALGYDFYSVSFDY